MNKKLITTVAMSLGIFLVMLDTTIMNIALPAIQKGLAVEFTQLSWALNIYTIIFATLTIPLSKLGDIFGRNKIYLLGLIFFASGSFLSGIAPAFSLLIIGRIISSIGAAIILPLGNTIGISAWKMSDRFKIIAILGLTQGGAAAVGPTLGGILTDLLSWHWIFLTNIPIVLIAIFLSMTALTFKENTEKIKIDFLGSSISMLALFSLTLALIKVREWGILNFKSVICFTASLLLGILFIQVERKAKAPMIDLALFKIRSFTTSVIVALVAQFFYIGVVVILPTYLTNALQDTELQAALILLPMSLTVFAFGGLGSLAINKLGPRLLIFIGLLSILLSYVLLVLTGTIGTFYLSLSILALGIGFGIIAGPINILAASNLNGTLLTSSQSVISVVRQIGSVLGVSIFASLMSANLNQASINNSLSLKQAYLSIYSGWIPVLVVLLLLTFAYPTKKNYQSGLKGY
ncbi:MFS transporter [Enterococcus sp. HY326]|uniref:MFS transporter n=1 Tax=Enterococcus sp. HY326 TaxID=2971265 RepID=UPI00223EBAC1|nr:MFS transporter [Enterococcus sp. HY326]